MSLQVFLDGKEVDASGVSIHADHVEGVSGTFSLDPSVAIRSGTMVSVAYEGKEVAAGAVARTSRGSGPTSVSFTGAHSFRPAISAVDGAIISEFLIDSFARGWAREDGVVGRD